MNGSEKDPQLTLLQEPQEKESVPEEMPLGFSGGEQLRSVRKLKGLSLQEVSDVLMVRKLYLSAIEEERMKDLPEAVYAKGVYQGIRPAAGTRPG